MLKTAVLLKIVIIIFRIPWWTESSKEQHLFDMEIFFVNYVFTVNFDKLNVSLLNKSI